MNRIKLKCILGVLSYSYMYNRLGKVMTILNASLVIGSEVSVCTEYYDVWVTLFVFNCTFGLISKDHRYKPKSNFSMKLKTFVEAGPHTGFFVLVTRKSDRQQL